MNYGLGRNEMRKQNMNQEGYKVATQKMDENCPQLPTSNQEQRN